MTRNSWREKVKRSALSMLTLLIAASLMLAACGRDAIPSTVRVATDATNPPFEMIDEQTGSVTGFDVDLMKTIAQKAGFNVEFENIDYNTLLANMAHCQYDAAVSAITITPEIQQSMHVSDPYINVGQIVTVRKDNSEIIGKDSLGGKTVGAEIGSVGALELQNISGAKEIDYDTIDLAFQDLLNGKIDAVVTDYPTALETVAKHPAALKLAGDVFTNESYGIAVCSKENTLLKKINETLAALKSDGTLQQLEQKWLAGASQ
jgi:polar amino acid transport system substrate-binding protein